MKEAEIVYVYVLKSIINNDLYVGISKDYEKRIKEHNSGSNKYTKGLKPWIFHYLELYPNYKSAREREKYLKSGVGKEYLKSLVP